ncbi:MAG: exodeoxyribonuclease VII small subunit [Verrucomicrobia bacterium]|jgi:exodeoxyribonuclease VII small subunit|nr:exodeoxyribonuclease VII small subunit [Verrucomicrobiota bacterium]
MTAAKKSGATQSFEKSMDRLESIVGDMEGGELSLDTMIQRFEEGQSLIKFCSGKLDEVERKIEKLLTKDGEVETEPFGDAPEPPPIGIDDADDDGESLLF